MLLNKYAILTAASLIAVGACTQQEVVQYDEITVDIPTGKYDRYPTDPGGAAAQPAGGLETSAASAASAANELKVEDLTNPNPNSSWSPQSSWWPQPSWWPQTDPGLDLPSSVLEQTNIERGGGGDIGGTF